MPSLRQLLAAMVRAWAERRDEVEEAATSIATHIRAEQDLPTRLLEALEQEQASESDGPRIGPSERLTTAVRSLQASFDARNGGWGGAPKFPQPMAIEFLLREHVRTGAREPRLMAERTLDAMADGGIYDHLGGGFARYSTDARWLVPHFEKMLYDSAQLARVYTHAFQVTGDERYAYVARETLDFVAHELRQPPGGAFAASLDADTDGVEGLTYTWRATEIRDVLGGGAALFEAAYGVGPAGNWEGRTILERVRDDTSLAVEFERPRDEIREALAQARVELLRRRDGRPQPARDDKVLASWNGLALAALADAGRALGEPPFLEMATEAADFLLRELRSPDGRLLRSWKDGRARHPAVLEDHAHLADGLLALYEATFEERFFVAARELTDLILEHFRAEDGSFCDTADDAEPLVARPRSLQDNALPSGGAMATLVSLRVAALTGEGRYRTAAEAAMAPMAALASEHPTGFAQWLLAFQLASAPIDEVAVVGDLDASDTRALLAEVHRVYRPGLVLAAAADPESSAVPLLHDRTRLDGKATAYICRGLACRQPVTDPTALTEQLTAPAQ
jgi:uncharacterized protein YyaL (SSP411 family)